MSENINTENKNTGSEPKHSGDIDINELLRRYLPDEYEESKDGKDDVNSSSNNNSDNKEKNDSDNNDNEGIDTDNDDDDGSEVKEYGSPTKNSSEKRLEIDSKFRRPVRRRRPSDTAQSGTGEHEFKDIDDSVTAGINDENNDGNNGDNDNDYGFISDVSGVETDSGFIVPDTDSDVKTADIKSDNNAGGTADVYSDLYEPDADIFAEFDEKGEFDSYEYIDDGNSVDTAATTVINKTEGAPATSDENEVTRENNIVGKDAETSDSDAGKDDANDNANDGVEAVGTDDSAFEYSDDTIDDFDMNILLGLGMDDKLEETVGIDKVSKFVEKQQVDLEKTEQLSRERAALDYEYTSKTQTREVINAYQSAYLTSKIKLIAAAVLTLILFLYECHSMLGIKFGGAFDPAVYPVVYIMVGFQILVLIAAPAIKSIISGTREFFRGKPSPEGMAVFALFIDVVYNVSISFVSVYPEGGPALINLPVAACFLMLYLYEMINIRREIFSFSIISSKKRKFALHSLSMAQSVLELNAFSDMMDEEDDADDISVLKIENAGFVNDYFLRTNRYPGGRKFIGFIIPAAVVVAAAFFAYKYNATGTFYGGINAAFTSALMCLPVSVFYMFSHPFYRAVERAYEDESTIVGESSVEEYADAAIISFDDKNVFPSTGVNVRAINVFGENRIDRVLYYGASVFCTVGGPLSDVFDLATRDIGYSSDVQLISCIPGYLEMNVDGETISIGGLKALETAGIRIPAPLAERDVPQDDPTVSVMYMAQNGIIIARMSVQYLVDSDFEFTLKQLDKSGMFIGIKTFDPNVTEEFIDRQVKLGNYPIRVIRCKSLDDRTKVTDNSVSGLVSKGSPKALLQTVTLCEKILHTRSINTILVIISLFISLVLTALSVLFGAFTISPLFIVLYQLIYIIPMWFSAKMI